MSGIAGSRAPRHSDQCLRVLRIGGHIMGTKPRHPGREPLSPRLFVLDLHPNPADSMAPATRFPSVRCGKLTQFHPCSQIARQYRDFVTTVLPQNTPSRVGHGSKEACCTANNAPGALHHPQCEPDALRFASPVRRHFWRPTSRPWARLLSQQSIFRSINPFSEIRFSRRGQSASSLAAVSMLWQQTRRQSGGV